MSETTPRVVDVAAEMAAWLDEGGKGSRQWNGAVRREIEAVLSDHGWRRSRADEGYSRHEYRAYRHPEARGRFHVTEAFLFGSFTLVERMPN